LKLLSDKGDLDKLYGRISIGILLIQDIVATFLLIVIPTLNSSQQTGLGTTVLILLGKGALAIFLLVLVARYLVPKMSFFFATSQELLFMFSLAWGFGTASLFSMLGFSVEVGALIAGVALSLSPFAYEIGSRMKPLRDFFVMLFFVLLGTHIVVSDIREMLVPVSILIAFVVVGNPLIVFILLNIFGFRRKTSFLTAVTFAQISEFSLILAALGMSLGHISEQVVSLITLVGVVTIAGSTYVIMHAEYLYSHLEWLLKLLEVRRVKKREARHAEGQAEALIFGYDRVGMDFVSAIEKLGTSYLVVDFSPIAIRKLQSLNVPFRYGDAEDVEFLEELNLEGVKIIVSTIPDFEANYLLVRTYRRLNPSGIILVISHDVEEAKKLYLAGASYVIMPHFLGAHYASQMISRHGLDVAEFERERNIHLSKLAKRLA
jgi:voltage-gated potassium channel Kch